ncbi:SHOCT domain-containing protein [Salinisphaera sp. SPP-AMP-43]|uniref:SHOCT domain-containing protein n=1 Tax=Salinisphaera sp. SPP-AMP-43 TaxID=3121288 RepID=UPI003C6DCCC1
MNAPTNTEQHLARLAEQYGFSHEAVAHLFEAVSAGGGDMAMFDHPEYRGPGQWMRGGLIMITDPADGLLKNRIDALCHALSRLLRESTPDTIHRRISDHARAWDTPGNLRHAWWPAELGEPAISGETERLAYAYFEAACRFAIRYDGAIVWYDTGEHRLTGIAQHSGASPADLVLTSTQAALALAELKRIESVEDETSAPGSMPGGAVAGERLSESTAIFEALERLAALRDQGVLTEDEFVAKKQELLSRL